MAEAALPHTHAVSDPRAQRFAAIIIVGHALKHIYISGFQAVLLPEIKLGLNLSSAQVGTMATVLCFAIGFRTLAGWRFWSSLSAVANHAGSCCAPGTSPITCDICRGTGQIQRAVRSLLGNVMTSSPCGSSTR